MSYRYEPPSWLTPEERAIISLAKVAPSQEITDLVAIIERLTDEKIAPADSVQRPQPPQNQVTR